MGLLFIYPQPYSGFLSADEPLDDTFGDKPQHAESQAQKNHESAEFARFRFPGKLSDDEQHVEHERAHANGQTEPGELFFVESPHQT